MGWWPFSRNRRKIKTSEFPQPKPASVEKRRSTAFSSNKATRLAKRLSEGNFLGGVPYEEQVSGPAPVLSDAPLNRYTSRSGPLHIRKDEPVEAPIEKKSPPPETQTQPSQSPPLPSTALSAPIQGSEEDITALPASPKKVEHSPHLQPVPESETNVIAGSHPPISRPGTRLSKRFSFKRNSEDFVPREQPNRVTSLPTPIPKRPGGESPQVLKRDSKRLRSDLTKPLSKRSSVDLSFSGSPRASTRVSMGALSDTHRFDVGIMDVLSPRPTLRFTLHGQYSASALRSGAPSRADTKREKEKVKEKGKDIPSVSRRALKSRKTVNELADDLDSGNIRELMERDERRKERKRKSEDERARKRLERYAENAEAESQIVSHSEDAYPRGLGVTGVAGPSGLVRRYMDEIHPALRPGTEAEIEPRLEESQLIVEPPEPPTDPFEDFEQSTGRRDPFADPENDVEETHSVVMIHADEGPFADEPATIPTDLPVAPINDSRDISMDDGTTASTDMAGQEFITSSAAKAMEIPVDDAATTSTDFPIDEPITSSAAKPMVIPEDIPEDMAVNELSTTVSYLPPVDMVQIKGDDRGAGQTEIQEAVMAARENAQEADIVQIAQPAGAKETPQAAETAGLSEIAETTETGDKDAETGSRRSSGLANLLRRSIGSVRGSREKRRKERGEGSVSEQGSVSREQSPAAQVASENVFRRSSTGTPTRTRSKFRENLPDAPETPPVPVVRYVEDIQDRPASPPSPGIADENEATPMASHTGVGIEIDESEPGPSTTILPQSLGSPDSEGSWLSGRPPMPTSPALSSGRPAQQRRTSNTTTMTATTEDYFTPAEEYPPAVTPGGFHSAASEASRAGDISSDDDSDSSDTESQITESMMTEGRVARVGTFVHREPRVQSAAGLLEVTEDDFGEGSDEDGGALTPQRSGREGLSSSRDPSPGRHSITEEEEAMEEATIERAISTAPVTQQAGHARQISAGSAKLLDIPKRYSANL